MTEPCDRRWRRRPDARPEEILQAAMLTFVEKGFAATRLDDIAARAGVSKGTLYLYFDSKEALFRAAVQESVLPHLQAAEALVASHEGSAQDLLRRLFLRWAELLGAPALGGLSKLMIAEAHNFPDTARFYIDEVVLRMRRVFAEAFRRGVRQGEFRDLPVDLLVRELTTPVIFATVWTHSLAAFDPQPLDYPRYISAHLDVVMNGIRREEN